MPTVDTNSEGSKTLQACPLCDTPLDPANPAECPKCDWVLGYRRHQREPFGTQRDVTSLALSVIPGLGHLYKGHRTAAALWFAGALVVALLLSVLATGTMGLALLLFPLYWGAVMLHVYWLDDWSLRHART